MAEREIWSVDKIRGLFDLTGKVAIVTGGSGAFGHDAAKAHGRLRRRAWSSPSRRAENVEAAAADIAEATGAKVLPVSCDVTDPESVEAMVQKTVDEFGKVDILVSAAGQANRFAAEEFPIDEWQKVMDSLVKGTYLVLPGRRQAHDRPGRRQDHHRRLRARRARPSRRLLRLRHRQGRRAPAHQAARHRVGQVPHQRQLASHPASSGPRSRSRSSTTPSSTRSSCSASRGAAPPIRRTSSARRSTSPRRRPTSSPATS